jgi:hypothetical protein
MKIKLLLISSLILLLIGCAKPAPQIVYTTIEVEVPVYTIPEFVIPDEPYIPLDDLTREDIHDHNKIGKAYVLSIEIYETYTFKLRNLLEGIQKGRD